MHTPFSLVVYPLSLSLYNTVDYNKPLELTDARDQLADYQLLVDRAVRTQCAMHMHMTSCAI